MTQELREKVARAIYDAGQTWLRDNPFNFPTAMPPQVLADAAIAIIRGETLEEAAKVAEGYERVISIQEPPDKWLMMPDGTKVQFSGSKIVDRTGCDDIAAAIRALKDKPANKEEPQ